MAASDKIFAGSIPKTYDERMVPLIFDGFARDLAQLVASSSPTAVIETAAGTGVLTRALAPLLPGTARYVVTDLNQPMLDFAARRQGPDDRITWLQADALALPVPDRHFDVVCCQFGAMFFPDRAAGYAEAKRVLAPGGRLVFNVWDRIENNVFADEVTLALGEMFPHDPPRFLARTPHGYHDDGAIRADLAAAGFSQVSIERVSKRSSSPSALDVAIAYCQGTPVRSEIEARAPGRLAAATDHVAAVLSRRHGQGAISAKIQALVIVAED